MESNQSPQLQSLNERSARLCETAIEQAKTLDIKISQEQNVTLLDFGVGRKGTEAAGLLLSRICMADLAEISILPPSDCSLSLPQLKVATQWPQLACIAAQYAGWPFALDSYYAMASGPGRLIRGKEEILTPYVLKSPIETAVICLESDHLPGTDECRELSRELSQAPNLFVCVAPTNSIPGTLQVIARSIETAMHKIHELKFDLDLVNRGMGIAPIPPLGKTSFQSLGWTNDAILYGGYVDLWFNATQAKLEPIIKKIASNTSADFGAPFETIFRKYDHDFYKIDRMLFSPAEVCCHSLQDDRQATSGERRPDILTNSFGDATRKKP